MNASLVRKAALAALAVLAVFPIQRRFSEEFGPLSASDRIASGEILAVAGGGERLLHGIPGSTSLAGRMPLTGVAQALCLHVPRWAWASASALVWLAPLALSFQLGLLLFGDALGGLAALVLIPPLLVGGMAMDETSLYRLLILAVANLLAWRAQGPSFGRSALLGVGIGLSLLCRSTLFLFPAALVIIEAARPEKSRRWDGAATVLVSYLFLIPWIVMNWRVLGRFVPFEAGRADQNVVLGALGYVTGEGINVDHMRLAGIPAGANIMRWATGFVLRHPINYALAYAARIAYVVSLHPAYAFAALVSFGPCRGRRDHGQIGLLALYFIAIYCTMPVGDRYLDPIWPIAAMMAANGFAAATGAKRCPRGAPILWFYLAPVLALGLFTLFRVCVLPVRSMGEEEALDEALARNPGDLWLRYLRGRRYLGEGRVAAAVGDLSLAYALDEPLVKLDFFWALTAEDAAPEELRARIHALHFDWGELDRRKFQLELLWFLQRRDDAGTRRVYSLIRDSWKRDAVIVRRTDLAPMLVLPEESLDSDLLGLLAVWPPAKRRELAGRLERFVGKGALSLEQAKLSCAAGAAERPKALEAIARAERLNSDPERLRQVGLCYQEIGEWGQAERLFEGLVRAHPETAKFRSDLGVVEALDHKTEAAIADLREALRLDPRGLAPYLTLGGLYASSGRREETLRLYESALARPPAPSDAAVWNRIREEKRRLP